MIELALELNDIRRDGWPRSTSRPDQPGVLLSFVSKKVGPLQFACDAFLHWHDNLRAIALTLHRLRMADLYGATSKAEQYTGFAQLPAPAPVVLGPFVNCEAAAQWLWEIAGKEGTVNNILFAKESYGAAYRKAAFKTHPDRNQGKTEDFVKLQAASQLLEKLFGP